jgi:hypothetical protein
VEEWARQRERAIAVRAAELARREAAEVGQAREMLRDFVTAAHERGIPAVPLAARSHDGRRRYRTRLRGWYLRADEGLAAGEDGEFYILSVPGSVRAVFSGATVSPAKPRLVIGEGGRDGERVTLRALLDRILSARA